MFSFHSKSEKSSWRRLLFRFPCRKRKAYSSSEIPQPRFTTTENEPPRCRAHAHIGSFTSGDQLTQRDRGRTESPARNNFRDAEHRGINSIFLNQYNAPNADKPLHTLVSIGIHCFLLFLLRGGHARRSQQAALQRPERILSSYSVRSIFRMILGSPPRETNCRTRGWTLA